MTTRATGAALALVGLAAAPALAGTYLGTTECPLKNPTTLEYPSVCTVGKPQSNTTNNDTNVLNPQSVVHPITFQQAGGNFVVRLCTNEADGTGVPKNLQWAIDTWNALVPTTENCFGCGTWEGMVEPTVPSVMAGVLLHEVGHCALALEHPEMPWILPDGKIKDTSFTRSWGAATGGGMCHGVPSTVLAAVRKRVILAV